MIPIEPSSTSGAPTHIATHVATASAARWLVLAEAGRSPLATDAEGGTTVSSRDEFVRLLRVLQPRLAVVSCPPASATEILAASAERHRRPALRLILLTEPGDITSRLDALALGFDDALPMSVDPRELLGRVRLLLGVRRRPTASDRNVAIAPGVVLDPVGRRVHKDGAEVHLRPKEFALLALLASDPGRVFSRSELVDRAWGPAYTGGSRTVDVHVRWLRAKIERDPARPRHVVTVRGAGYRLDPSADGDETAAGPIP